jgi:hypothetical protein
VLYLKQFIKPLCCRVDSLLQMAYIVNKNSHKAVTIVIKGIKRTFQKALIVYYTLYNTKPY